MTPAIYWWWASRGLAQSPDDPLLPERLIELRRRSGYVSGAVWVPLIAGWVSSIVWAFPLMLCANLIAAYPMRRRLYGDSWGLAAYCAFHLRIGVAFYGFWLLLFTAPTLIAAAGRYDWAAAVVLGAGLCVWNRQYLAVVRALAGTKPIDDTALVAEFRGLIERAGIKAPLLEVLPMSGGVVPNAVALPSRRQSAVLMTSTLLERLERDEIVAICAHEIAHIEYYDAKRLRRAAIGGYLLISVFVLAEPITLHLLEDPWVAASTSWWFVVGVGLLVSRAAAKQKHETEADVRAVALTGNPDALVRALTKLHTIGLFPRRWDPSVERRMTHPSLARRIQAIRASAQLPEQRLEAVATFGPGDEAMTFHADSLEIAEKGGGLTHTIGYERLTDLRIDVSSPYQPRLVAADKTNHKWSVPLTAEDVPRVQAALDVVDTRLGRAAVRPAVTMTHAVPVVLAALTLSVAFACGQFALFVPAMLAALTPAAPLLAGAGAGAISLVLVWQGNGFGLAADGWTPLAVVLCGALLLGAAWKTRKDDPSRWARLSLAALALFAASPVALVLLNMLTGGDAVRLHETVNGWPSVVVLLVSCGAALGTWRRALRPVGALMGIAAVALAAIASRPFVEAFGKDPFVAASSAIAVKTLDWPMAWEMAVPPRVSGLVVSPAGRRVMFLQIDRSARIIYRVGQPSGETAEHEANQAFFADDDHLLLVDENRDGTTLREVAIESRTNSDTVWETTLPGLSAVRAWVDPRSKTWRVIGRRENSVVSVEGVLGGAEKSEHSWPLTERENDEAIGPTQWLNGSAAHVLLGHNGFFDDLSEQSALTIFAATLVPSVSKSTFWILGPEGRRPLAVSQLPVDCDSLDTTAHGVAHPLCLATEHNRTTVFELDLATGRITAVGWLPGLFSKTTGSSRGSVVGWLQGSGLLAVDPGRLEAWRVVPRDKSYVHSLAVSDQAIATLSYAHGRMVARVYPRPSQAAEKRILK